MKKIAHLNKEQLNCLNDFKDGKSRSSSELKRAIAIILSEDKNNFELIKTITGYNRQYSIALRKKYSLKGINSLKDRKKKQPRALLTKGQRDEVLKTIQTMTPRTFGYPTDYWTTNIVGKLIFEQYGVQYKSRTALTLIFKKAKFTYHKPGTQYHKRSQENIDQWKSDKKTEIENALADEKTIVLVADEMMLSTQTTTQKIWLPQGEVPKIDISNKRGLRCIYGFLNMKTGQEHAFKTNRANSAETCKVLEQIGELYKGYKIVIIWDNAPWHKSALVKDFLTNTKHLFYLISFPPYAPELNPQEHVWKAGRSQVTHNQYIEDIDKTTDQFVSFLNNKIFDYQLL